MDGSGAIVETIEPLTYHIDRQWVDMAAGSQFEVLPPRPEYQAPNLIGWVPVKWLGATRFLPCHSIRGLNPAGERLVRSARAALERSK